MNANRNRQSKRLVTGLLSLGLMLPCLTATVWASVTVNPQALTAKVEEYIRRSTPLAEPGAQLIVDVAAVPSTNLTLNGETIQYDFSDNRTSATPYRAMVQVTLTTESDTRHINVPVRISIDEPVWVARKQIHAKDALSLDAVAIERKHLDYESAYCIGASEPITTYSSRTNIAPGEILDSRKLAKTPAVYTANDIHIILTMGNGIRVTAIGRALETGAIGQNIKVSQRLGNDKIKIYSGKIIDKNTVLVEI